jgi:hypothetical protein
MNKRELRKLLCSMLLGDGYIIKETKTSAPQFGFRHSEKQKDYANWKADKIDSIFQEKNLTRRTRRIHCITNKIYKVIQVNLSWASYMRILRKIIYKNKIKNIEYILSQIESKEHLAIWFMDDGSEERSKNKHLDGSYYVCNPRLMLHICNFTEGQANLAVEWFKQKYKVEPRIVRTSKKQGAKPRLRFLAKDSVILFNEIKPYIKQLESMRKKFRLCLERY